MTEREKLTDLILNVPKLEFPFGSRAQGKTYQTAQNIADHLLANGVMLVDTNTVNLVTNREPIQTAFGMPLDELADLIRAKQEGRIIVPPCKVGDKVYVLITKKSKNYSVFTYIQRTRVTECNFFRLVRNFGETVFLAKEEAEKALKERR